MIDGALYLASARLSSTCTGRALIDFGFVNFWRQSMLEASSGRPMTSLNLVILLACFSSANSFILPGSFGYYS